MFAGISGWEGAREGASLTQHSKGLENKLGFDPSAPAHNFQIQFTPGLWVHWMETSQHGRSPAAYRQGHLGLTPGGSAGLSSQHCSQQSHGSWDLTPGEIFASQKLANATMPVGC